MMDLLLIEKIAFITARCFGMLSLLSAVCVGLESFADWQDARRKSQSSFIATRVQFLLQFPLGIYAFTSQMLGTLPAPADSTWLAAGTEASCNAQGFVILMMVTTGIPLDAFKSLTYLLGIQYGWNEERLRRIEPIGYILILGYAFLVSVWSLVADWLGPNYDACFLRIPEDCKEADDLLEPCLPSPSGVVFARMVVFVMNMLHLFFSIYVVTQIYRRAVLTSTSNTKRTDIPRKVATKGMLYAVAVSVAQIPLLLWFILFISGFEGPLLIINLMIVLTLSLVGFFNMLVFALYRSEMKTAYGRVVRKILDAAAHSFCCCFVNRAETETSTKDSATENEPKIVPVLS